MNDLLLLFSDLFLSSTTSPFALHLILFLSLLQQATRMWLHQRLEAVLVLDKKLVRFKGQEISFDYI